MAKVKFSSLIESRLNLAQDELEVQATNLKDLFRQIVNRNDGLEKYIFTENGEISPFFSIFVNNDQISYKDHDLKLSETDEVFILNIIAGG